MSSFYSFLQVLTVTFFFATKSLVYDYELSLLHNETKLRPNCYELLVWIMGESYYSYDYAKVDSFDFCAKSLAGLSYT